MKKVLSVAGYPKWAWQAPGRKNIRPHPRNMDCDRAKGHVTLPYIRGVTEPISRLIRKTWVAAHAKPHITTRSIIVAPKDKDHPQDKCGVVYERLKEHQKDSSPVGHHMGYNKHTVDSLNNRIVDRDSRWFQRGVREAIQIRSRSPTLNRDRCRHNLPSVYNTIVWSRDTGMTAAVSRDITETVMHLIALLLLLFLPATNTKTTFHTRTVLYSRQYSEGVVPDSSLQSL